ncbi:MFS transporter [Levilactobacillus hammesii]|uniref:Major facilitator superfamily transporter permease n=1 Tax=Levilactobacillus hammesii DSM 16381 TaxID=1423753 RepID=A0A0R1UYM7_9LACO|nr:major facilitator superfamily transporter permease [Levilactobacillus hammesii DSM 16381]
MMTKTTSTKWLLGLTSLGFFMSMMDAMIVTTASTAIRTDFHISVSTLQWALNAYNITIAAVLLVGVALGERWGRRRIYNWGILIFTLGSALCALAGNIGFLILARVIAGIGASVMTPMSMAILSNTLPASERGRALGIWSGIGGLALIVGPSLGGVIVARLAWQWIFWINVPVGIAAIALSRQYLPESRGDAARVNLLDGLLITLTLAGLIWVLSTFNGSMTGQLVLVGLVGVVSLGSGAWFLKRQTVATNPMVSLSLFKSAQFNGSNMATACLYGSMYGVVFFLPQFFQLSQGASALTAGLELLPWTGTLVVIAPFAGRAVDRFGEGRLATLGLFLQGLGYALIAELVRQQRPYSWLVLPLVFAGMGLSMAGPALQKAVLGAVPRGAMGQASGIYNVFRLFGGAVGTTLAVLIFSWVGGNLTLSKFIGGFQVTMLGTALLSWLGIWWTRRLLRH